MTRNWMTTSSTRLLFSLVVSLLFLQTPVCISQASAWQDDEAQAADADDEDEEEDEEDDEEMFVQNNPWGFDSRKLEAAELFWFRKVFAIEVLKIKSICDLDKKQALKLKVATKGAAKKEFEVWKKKYDKQMQQFQGMNINNGNGNKKKKRKKFVIEDADEIDQQIMQYLNNSSMFGGQAEEARKAIDSDFWRKTVRGVLEPEQFKKYESFLAERKKAHIDAKVDAFVLKMREDLGMTEEQTEQYDALIRPKLEKAPVAPGYYQSFVFQYYATKYDKKKMKALLDEDQYQVMKMMLGPSKSYGHMFDQQDNAVEEVVIGNNFLGFSALQTVMSVLEGFNDGINGLIRGFDNFAEGMARAVGVK